jgi:DNA-directed RNA polymerase III subunit RPC4
MAGAAYGMGKIQGSFALAPVWGDEEDWVVDPKDLEIPVA